MDIYWNKPPRVFTLIKVIFYFLAAILFTGLVLVFVLKINESVSFDKGEIFSRNAPIEYRAPYEATVEEISVKEGDPVAVGDTLMLLKNETLTAQYHAAKEGYWLSLANLNLYKKQLENMEAKIAELQGREKLIQSRFYSSSKNRSIELSSLEKQVLSLKENLAISEDQLEKDRLLLESGAISDSDYKANYQKHLDKLNQMADLQKQYDLQVNAKKNLSNTFSGETKDLKMLVLNSDFELVNMKKLLLEEESLNQKFADQLEFTANELKKLVVTSSVNGYVSRLFNTKKESNYVTKGTSLVTVRPEEEESFYAKVLIPQESISKVDTGQAVHFRVDAYNFYQYGILEGRVEHISRQDTTENFYLLADIHSGNTAIDVRSGYQVEGDIILREVRLYRFILNRLFRKVNG